MTTPDDLPSERTAFDKWCIAPPESAFYRTAWEAWQARAAAPAAPAQPAIGTPQTDPDYEHSEAFLRSQPLTDAQIDDAARLVRIAPGEGAYDFNDGVDTLADELKRRAILAAPPPPQPQPLTERVRELESALRVIVDTVPFGHSHSAAFARARAVLAASQEQKP